MDGRASRRLIANGSVQMNENPPIQMTSAGTSAHSSVTAPTTLIEKIHSELKKNIIAGHHQPGEKLRITPLMQQYGVSGSTLREALTLLMNDKLVIAERQSGFTVSDISVEDLIDLHRMRKVLEKEAVRQAVIHGDDEWEANVVSSAHFLSRASKALGEDPTNHELLDEWELRHRGFHLALILATPSEWNRHFLSILYQQYERYRHLYVALAEELQSHRDAEPEHVAIVRAVLARDAGDAERLVDIHISHSIAEWERYFCKLTSS